MNGVVSIKVLIRILEGLAWFLWIGSLSMLPQVMKAGHYVMGVSGYVLLLPAAYYLLRKLLKRHYKVVLALLRAAMIIGGILLVGFASEPKFEFSERKAVDFAKNVLLERYEHDATFVYEDYEVKKGKIPDPQWSYIIPVQVKFSYQLENGDGKLVKKEATYVFYWNGMTDEYEDEHWELYDNEKVYWETGKNTPRTLDLLKELALIFISGMLPVILLVVLIEKRYPVHFPSEKAKWKVCAFVILVTDFVHVILGQIFDGLTNDGSSKAIIFILMFVMVAAQVLVMFVAVWLGADRFKGYAKKQLLYVSVCAAMSYSLYAVMVSSGDPMSPLRFLSDVLFAPCDLAAISVFAYFYLTGRKIRGLLLASLARVVDNYFVLLVMYGVIPSGSLLHIILMVVIGLSYYFIFGYIHFVAAKRIEGGALNEVRLL